MRACVDPRDQGGTRLGLPLPTVARPSHWPESRAGWDRVPEQHKQQHRELSPSKLSPSKLSPSSTSICELSSSSTSICELSSSSTSIFSCKKKKRYRKYLVLAAGGDGLGVAEAGQVMFVSFIRGHGPCSKLSGLGALLKDPPWPWSFSPLSCAQTCRQDC